MAVRNVHQQSKIFKAIGVVGELMSDGLEVTLVKAHKAFTVLLAEVDDFIPSG